MKKMMTLALLLAVGTASNAQNVDTKKVNELVVKKDFIGAITELNSIKRQIQELASAELQKAFPKSVGEFVLKPAEAMRSDMSGGLSLQLIYEKPSEKPRGGAADSSGAMAGAAMPMSAPPIPGMGGDGNSITVSLSTNVSGAFELMNAHSGGEQPMTGSGAPASEAIRIKGYRALIKNDQYIGPSGQLLVGGAFIDVRATGQKDTKNVRALLEAIDCNLLKSVVWE